MIGFLAAAWVQPDALGITSEEILPHLFRHPRVADGSFDPLAGEPLMLAEPFGRPGEASMSGLVVSTVWPTLSLVRPPRSWPLLTESWQAAYLSYYARALAPLLGHGIAGLRRSNGLLGVLALLVLASLAMRLAATQHAAALAVALLGSSVGFLFLHRTAYLIESGPPLFAALALWLCQGGRLRLAGLAAGLAVALKVTAAWELLGFALYLVWARRLPRAPARSWFWALLLGAAPLTLFAVGWAATGVPAIGRKLGLLAAPVDALARLPRTAWVVATWLGDPVALLGPLFAGDREVPPAFGGALMVGLVTAAALFRVRFRRADCEPERLWLSVAAVVVVLAALFYDDRYPVQVAFLCAPWYALCVARSLVQLAHLPSRWPIGRLGPRAAALLVGAAALLVQGRSLLRYAEAHRAVKNPMLSAEAQRALADALDAQGARQPLTTTYNAVGVLEHLSVGRIDPVHLYPLLVPHPGDDAAAYQRRAQAGFRSALGELQGPVVLPVGGNLFEGLGQDPAIVRAAFFAACADLGRHPREVGRYPAGDRALFALFAVEKAP
ncbi:MAG: hypothetical protein EXR72_20915 [Myxococcales bacterium]|nr:hypothetical protein [Myxococcales bacterium]